MEYILMYRLKGDPYEKVQSCTGKISEIMTAWGDKARKFEEFQLNECESGQRIAASRGDAVIIYGDMPLTFSSLIKEFRARKGREEPIMALSKNKKADTNKEVEQAQELAIEVVRAHDLTKDGQEGCNIAVDLKINGVTIYGCFYREGKDKNGKDYQLVSFPSHKGNDGKYYNYAYVKLQQSDIDFISSEIEKLL